MTTNDQINTITDDSTETLHIVSYDENLLGTHESALISWIINSHEIIKKLIEQNNEQILDAVKNNTVFKQNVTIGCKFTTLQSSV